jgi:hypothetical protein
MKDQMITGDLCVYHEHVYDDHVYKDVVKGKFRLNNISDKKTLIQYHVMFKDKKGLLAKTSGHIHLASGLEQIVHLSSIPLHIKDIQNISDYEIKLIAK